MDAVSPAPYSRSAYICLQHGAPGPAAAHFEEHSFLHSQQDGDQPAAFRAWEHGAKEEQPELQSGYKGKNDLACIDEAAVAD